MTANSQKEKQAKELKRSCDNLKSKVAALEQQSQSDAIVVELKQSNDRLQMLWAATRTLAVAMAKDPVHLDTLLSNLHDQFIANK